MELINNQESQWSKSCPKYKILRIRRANVHSKKKMDVPAAEELTHSFSRFLFMSSLDKWVVIYTEERRSSLCPRVIVFIVFYY
jgi:hypothetical protein